jgi:hypothetical protein
MKIEHRFSCRLVGMIPCSDAFGVDLIIERYEEALAQRKKALELLSLNNKKDIL